MIKVLGAFILALCLPKPCKYLNIGGYCVCTTLCLLGRGLDKKTDVEYICLIAEMM